MPIHPVNRASGLAGGMPEAPLFDSRIPGGIGPEDRCRPGSQPRASLTASPESAPRKGDTTWSWIRLHSLLSPSLSYPHGLRESGRNTPAHPLLQCLKQPSSRIRADTRQAAERPQKLGRIREDVGPSNP